jgi:hypothetical protein
MQIGKEEVNSSSLFTDNMILYMNPKDSTRRILDLISTYSKVAGYEINIPKSVASLYTNNELEVKKSQKTNPIHNNLKKKQTQKTTKKPRHKLNQRYQSPLQWKLYSTEERNLRRH